WREFDGLPRPALEDIPEPVPAWRLPRALAAAFFVSCALLARRRAVGEVRPERLVAPEQGGDEQREVVL
ncbi:hypothetical protein, partial [Pseudomonas aeruginosa]